MGRPLQFSCPLMGNETLPGQWGGSWALYRVLRFCQSTNVQGESERTRMSSLQMLVLWYQEEEVSWAALKVFGRATFVTVCFSLKAGLPWSLGVQAAPLAKIKHERSCCYLESGGKLEILSPVKEPSRWKENRNILRSRKDVDVQGGKGVLNIVLAEMHQLLLKEVFPSWIISRPVSCRQLFLMDLLNSEMDRCGVSLDFSSPLDWGQERHPLGELTNKVPEAGHNLPMQPRWTGHCLRTSWPGSFLHFLWGPRSPHALCPYTRT